MVSEGRQEQIMAEAESSDLPSGCAGGRGSLPLKHVGDALGGGWRACRGVCNGVDAGRRVRAGRAMCGTLAHSQRMPLAHD